MLFSHVQIHSAVVSSYFYSTIFHTEIMPKPEKADYPDFYTRYVAQVPEVKLNELLASQCDKTKALFGGLSRSQAEYAYAPGKWTLKEVLGHIVDSERVFGQRRPTITSRNGSRHIYGTRGIC